MIYGTGSSSAWTLLNAALRQKMSEKIDRFEIVSQLAQSPLATVYKALDSESQQTVALKVVGFGMSAMNSQAIESAALPEVLHYAAPEQLRGETCDHRSMLFSLGAILYEMATEQKAFTGETAEQLRAAILEQTPPLPVRLKANVNAGLSGLIMKALAKSPDERYQSGQELVRDLEQCKNSTSPLKSAPIAAPAKPKAFSAAAGAISNGTPIAQ